MEHRRVQKTGGSSFIISLPKEWIVEHKIKEKDTLGIVSQPDGNLLVIPKIESEELAKEIEIDVDEFNDVNFLFRALIGAYIMGYSKKTIKSSSRFEPAIRDCISNFTQIAIGPEIIEETNNIIVIKDTLNPKEMPFEKTIRRMYILAGGMHEDALNALASKDIKLAEDVIKKDDEIDRLHWLIGRQSHIILRDIILSQKMGITLEDAYHYHQISRFLERIGDHAVKISRNVLNIINQEIDKEIIQNISRANKISMELLDNSMDAWRNKDIKKANQNIELVSDLITQCEEIALNPRKENVEIFIGISYIIESIRRTGEYAGDISEIIINNLIGL
jgi:phosphate uptake regulator